MVAVLSSTGIRLMPTSNYKARKLLKSGRAIIEKHFPFTVRLLDRADGKVQPIEYTCDTGYLYIGVSIASRKHEYVRAQYDLLKDEVQRHIDCRRYRTQRRRRLRYRKKRFNNRKAAKPKGWLAPSLLHKQEEHIRIFEMYQEVMPITSAVFEMGQFDTQVLKAIAEGKPIPEGTDYQHGERYGTATLREAVFTRDHYTCVFCGRSIKDNAILHTHHLGYLKGDKSNRLSNLATACEKCHTPKEHQKGGILYHAKPALKSFKGAAFMTTVRWQMLEKLREQFPEVSFTVTYGAATKEARRTLHLTKSHTNDAYAMGEYHPKHRAREEHYEKRRRNERVLEKFYDAVYIDSRDGQKKKGQQLFSGRSKRNKNTNTENLHVYRQKKVSKGHRSIRKSRTQLLPGSIVKLGSELLVVKGTHRKPDQSMNVEFRDPSSTGRKSASIRKLVVVKEACMQAYKKI